MRTLGLGNRPPSKKEKLQILGGISEGGGGGEGF